MKLYWYNKSTIDITCNPVQHDRTKHMEIDRHFMKEKLEEGLVCLLYILSNKQYVADVLTKGLNTDFYNLVMKLGMEDIYSST